MNAYFYKTQIAWYFKESGLLLTFYFWVSFEVSGCMGGRLDEVKQILQNIIGGFLYEYFGSCNREKTYASIGKGD